MNPVPLFLIIVTLPLLLGGCGEKHEAETKPVEEKQQEVKPELEGVENVELRFREDIAYLKGSDTPYTGKFYELYPSGKRNWEGSQKDGKPDGLHRGWHENGQKGEEVNFKDGKLDGLAFMWHENGQKEREGNYRDGKPDGLHREWYENGQKGVEENYKEGKLNG
ncbi:MAG: toxin-antitoxin system YwqK family antitoxin, partial [bacterium]|nr:toxin-antitoxin system YwqK family antitoxin [bacterium]